MNSLADAEKDKLCKRGFRDVRRDVHTLQLYEHTARVPRGKKSLPIFGFIPYEDLRIPAGRRRARRIGKVELRRFSYMATYGSVQVAAMWHASAF